MEWPLEADSPAPCSGLVADAKPCPTVVERPAAASVRAVRPDAAPLLTLKPTPTSNLETSGVTLPRDDDTPVAASMCSFRRLLDIPLVLDAPVPTSAIEARRLAVPSERLTPEANSGRASEIKACPLLVETPLATKAVCAKYVTVTLAVPNESLDPPPVSSVIRLKTADAFEADLPDAAKPRAA